MDWLEDLRKMYDDYVAPTVQNVKDFAGSAVDAVGNFAQGAGDYATDAGNWLQAQAPQMAPSDGGAGPTFNSGSDAGTGFSLPTIAPQGISQGVSSFVGNFGNSGSAGDGNAGESEAAQWMKRVTPSVVSQSPAGGFQSSYGSGNVGAPPGSGGGASFMGGMKAGMDSAKAFGQENKDVIGMATKLYGGYKQSQAADAYQRSLSEQASRENQINEANRSVTSQRNAGANDIFAEQKARIGMAGMQASRNTDAATARQVSALENNSKLSPAARAALAQKTKVMGSLAGTTAYTQADTAARAGLRAPELGQYSQASTTYGSGAARQQYANDSNVAPYADVTNDLFGLSKKKVQDETGVNT